MSDLDNKLMEIMDEWKYEQGVTAQPILDKVKRLFTAEELYKLPINIPPGYMTGAEWYARFEKELEKVGLDFNDFGVITMARKAAKRACGLEQ